MDALRWVNISEGKAKDMLREVFTTGRGCDRVDVDR